MGRPKICFTQVHAPFANPRAKSCWLSCAFQVLWHSRAWHTCFEAALEAGALETSEWDTPGAPKIEALVDTWREYRATLASHAPPPPKKARVGASVDTRVKINHELGSLNAIET